MAYNRGTEAVDYNRMNTRGSAAPARRQPAADPRRTPAREVPQPRLVKKTKAQLRAEQRRSTVKTMKVLAICAMFLSVIAFQIYSQVQVDELDRELNKINSEISVLESENTRLNMELDSRISLDKVDDYAQNVLGMVKVENYQVSYVDLSSADTVEVSGGREYKSPWELIKAYLN